MVLLNPRSWQLLKTTARGVRLIAPHQLARWWGVSPSSARRTLKALAAANFLQEVQVRARKIPPIDSPILRWRPGDPPPHFGKLSYRAKDRFRTIPPIQMTAYCCTKVVLAQFSVPGQGRIKQSQASHELGVTEAYLYAVQRWPLFTQNCWVGENVYSNQRRHGEKVEDAHFISHRTGEVLIAVEYAGTYPPERFEALHHQLKFKPYWIM